MKKIYMFRSSDGGVPFEEFIGKQDKKLKKKLENGFKCMLLFPDFMTEPHVKHFTIERYNRLYEYRERIKIMAWVIFTFDQKGDIILLFGFIKKNERDTMNALEQSVKLLAAISENPKRLIEYRIGESKK